MQCGNFDDVVESPCINVCKIENDVCIGCGRTLEEIAHWTRITNEERKLINERVSNNIQRT
jgi:predicted Fe-S protein YdhL (DUF1289 family)